MAKLCMGCMNPLPEGKTTCSICGFDPITDRNPEHCLPTATLLQGHYIVGRFTGEGSDCLTYLAYDRQLREPCFIQEFFPGTICHRDTIGGVQPMSGCERTFEEYADAFRANARVLARMRELPAVVPVYDIFEENGTVYAVSDYCQGMTLTRKIKLSGGRIPWNEARPLFMALVSTLTHLNEAGVRHLAICPDNIVIGADGKARLRNFSVPDAHRAGTDLAPDLKKGYAAPEQYRVDGEVDTRADVYGMAATVFRTVTGNEPPAGNQRSRNSDDLFMSADVAEELTQPVCVALFNALQVNPDLRTSTMAELRDQLSLTPTVSALKDEVEEDMGRVERKQKKQENKKKKSAAAAVIACLAALVLVGVVLGIVLGGLGSDDSSGDTGLPAFTTTTTTNEEDKPAVVDNYEGLNYFDLRDKKLEGDLVMTLDYTRQSDKPAGTILSQTPAAGEEVTPGSEIKVVISTGQQGEMVKVPNLSGWKEAHAKLYLEALGFKVKTAKLQVSNYEKGVVDSTDPKAGTEKRLGDTITLRVSNVTPTTTTTTTVYEDNTDTDSTDTDTATE